MEQVLKHPVDELLAAYSAGSLPLSQALCVSAHLEHCASCVQKLQRLNRVGSELMQQLEPAPASSRLKEDMLARLDTLRDDEPPAVTSDSAVPRCLRQFVATDYDHLDWKRVSPDIHTVELCRDSNGARVELIRIRPGGTTPTHTHDGDEYTVILEGSFSDAHGVYHKGDFVVNDSHVHHAPVATQDRECICLAVTEGPVRFTGFFSRLLNPLVRRSYA